MAKKNKNRKDGFVYSTNPDYDPDDNPFAGIFEAEEEGPQPPKAHQRLRVHLQRLKGNKTATVVKGFEGSDSELKALGKLLKTQCGVGGTVKNGEILLQGNVRDKVRDLLINSGYTGTKLAGG